MEHLYQKVSVHYIKNNKGEYDNNHVLFLR